MSTQHQHQHLYNTAAWRRLRLEQLRAHPLCRMHLELGQTRVATVADHVDPHRGDRELFFGGRLQSLCKQCHDAHKQAQEHRTDGILRGAGLDGRPIDLSHPWHRATASTQGGDQNSTPSAPETGPLPLFAGPRNG